MIRAPQPGMTRGFWHDPERYVETYWSRLPGTWVHGDWAIVDDDGYWYIRGRSDDTLKVAGKRVGPAEVEAAATAHPSVVEAAAIGVPHAVKGETIVVVCTLRPRRDRRRGPPGRDRAGASSRTSARRSSRRRSSSCRPCRRPAPARSCGASCGRPGSGLDPGDLSALDDPTTIEAIRRAGPTGAWRRTAGRS